MNTTTLATKATIYVDGSHIKGTKKLGFGAWGKIQSDGKVIKEPFSLSGTQENPLFKKIMKKFPGTSPSNPTMELFGLLVTLSKFVDTPNIELEICQDYNGVVNYGGLWNVSSGTPRAKAPWKASVPYIKYLVWMIELAIKCIQENGGSVHIRWVKGHQTIPGPDKMGNDKADTMAKSGKESYFSPLDDTTETQ